jgi:hypothetical protein
MANPTTNYGFVLPTSTDLVTDLPADFDVALQGVDTRLKALQPGTTLGDLAYSSATANTNTRLPIGTTSQVLTVVSGSPAWAAVPATTPTAVSCSVGKGNQSIPNNTATAVTWDVENYDTDNLHSTVTNTSRFTVPTGKGGKWLFQGTFMFAGNATGYRAAHIYKNGSLFTQYIMSAVSAVNGGIQWQQTINLSAADYLEIFALQDTGGALTLYGIGGIELSNAQFTYLGA